MLPDRSSLFGLEEAEGLLYWFDQKGLSYPWTENPAPYSVWVSEIMLQQTAVSTVIPYFNRWMQRFPTVESLAMAGEAEVLRYWEGLGYYSRARSLRAAARKILEEHGGKIPQGIRELKELPGVGEYTAAAVASLAYGRRVAAIDANVRRIALRLRGQEDWNAEIARLIKKDLSTAMPAYQPGNLNAALMQLGQLICRPRKPRCSLCPLLPQCRAAREGRSEEIPRRLSRSISNLSTTVMILIYKDKILLQHRKQGIGRGLWSFPPLPPEGAPGEKIGRLKNYVHVYTRYRETLTPQIFRVKEEDIPLPKASLWVPIRKLTNFPMPAVYRRLSEELTTFEPIFR